MKITFLVPPSLDKELPAERTAGCTRMVYPMPNIYELIVAAVLERDGHEVHYEDFVISERTPKDLIEFLKNDDSECYALWCVNLSLQTDAALIDIIREAKPQTWIITMGPGVTYYTDKLLKDERILVVRGEPELSVSETIKAINAGSDLNEVKGISRMVDGKTKHNPTRELLKDLDELPFPARHFIEQYTYTNPKLKRHPYTTLLTSRNCPFHCIYCVPSSLTFAREIENKRETGKKPFISYRSVENVIEEIDMLAAKGYKAICFIDDNFIINAKRLRPICDCLKKHNIVWGCQARADAINEEIAEILSDANCQYVDLGVESFNDDILEYIHKGITSQQIFEGIDILKRHKVPVKLNILIGTSPLETKETIKDTLKKAKELKVEQVMFNIVAPFPGTEFYEIAKKNNWIKGGDYKPTDVQHNSIINYPNLSSEEMERLLFWNNVGFFLRPSFIIKNIKKFNSWTDFRIALTALRRKLFHF